MKSPRHIRYLIRLKNNGYTPAHSLALLEKVRSLVHPFPVQTMNLRVSRFAVEFDLFLEPQKAKEPILEALSSLGEVLTCKNLDQPAGKEPDPRRLMEEARLFFKEERYWEVHEILEGLWKRAREPEKTWIQGVILAAAALVHQQKNEPCVARDLLADAQRRLTRAPESLHGFPVKALSEELAKYPQTQTLPFSSL